ncbi:hypothetical protein Zmor_018691 [Zophobas morio]|uniref:Uncharacterized protein n=1 Tax=Zophobas morio TaxID=2755281 RepID=A0AA38IF84_9CUCU|nr:hypothetical protein Zmor_018691 [Zophobas morio]
MDARDEKMKSTIEEVNGKMEIMDAKIDKQKDDILTSLGEKFQKEVEANKNEIEEIREEMKDVKTNLENMKNIVGRNMIAMENNMEDRMKTIEDQIKTFEKTMKNTATTGSCYVTSAPRTIQPSTYDGQTPWSSYKKQFETTATANLWEKKERDRVETRFVGAGWEGVKQIRRREERKRCIRSVGI